MADGRIIVLASFPLTDALHCSAGVVVVKESTLVNCLGDSCSGVVLLAIAALRLV